MLKNWKWLENYFFLKKKVFSGTSWMQFWLPFLKSIFTERQKSFCSRSHYEAIFWDKNVNISSEQSECIFDNPPRSFRPMLCEFYKPARPFSTTAEKLQPNVGRGMENYNLFRSNNDPRNVTLDIFTAIWTNALKKFHKKATWALRMKCLQHCRERFDEVGFFFAQDSK